jgi:hypothetical protein
VAAAPATTARAADAHGLLQATRGLLIASTVLTGLGFGALYLLAENTANSFAWTIQPPLTAAFLGAGYGAGLVLVVLALRDGRWVHARLPLYTILVFVGLTLVPTLLHFDRLHISAEFADTSGPLAKGAAWFWLAIYIGLPVVMVPVLLLQERAAGMDPPNLHPVPGRLRVALVVESILLVFPGLFMFAAPETAAMLWPWQLTPFTARVVAAWLIAFGVTAAYAAVGDLARLRIGTIAYATFGILVLLAIARYPALLQWDRPSAWILIGAMLAVVVTGVLGWRAAPRTVVEICRD